MSDDRVSIQRFTRETVDSLTSADLFRTLRELGPEGGDYVVIRAAPDRAEAIERNLVSQLFTTGAESVPSLGSPVRDAHNAAVARGAGMRPPGF